MKQLAILLLFATLSSWAQDDTLDSGGPLMLEQAAYDVTFYELSLDINPQTKSIAGSNFISTIVKKPFSQLVLDFDARFEIDSVYVSDKNGMLRSTFERKGARIYLDVKRKQTAGTTFKAEVFYHGQPRIAPRAPWSGGFVWETTDAGEPWVSVACQNNGADLWWPCKDHPSDEPDSMALHFTVPNDLQCITSGQLLRTTENKDGTTTFHWFVSTPINNYGLSFYIGPYTREAYNYTSVTGESMPMFFYYFPEHKNEFKNFMPQIPQQVRFFEELLGPYPFRIDKYAAVEAPYLGMEHQSCIAYGVLNSGGSSYNYGLGFDALHLHELAHEWWGNMLTASDWKDFWLHEGFATYMEALYAGHLHGQSGYDKLMNTFNGGIRNLTPLAPHDSRSTGEMYGGDIYYKGAWVLHTLRYVIGDDVFFESLQRFLYPDPALKKVKDGSHCRLVSSVDFIETVERVSNQNLDWFFQTYLRQARLPILQTSIKDDSVHLVWKIENDIPFPVDVPVKIGDTMHMVDMSSGSASLKLDPMVPPHIDPNRRILKMEQRINVHAEEDADAPLRFSLAQNYPNPFNNETTIEFTVPYPGMVEITVHDLRGKIVETVTSEFYDAGAHRVTWNASELPSGAYTYKIQAGDFVDLKKLVLLK